MSIISLAESFNQYFDIILADTEELKEASYKIRHQVYSEELNWIPKNSNEMEMDEFDQYAIPLLIRHKRTNQYIGTLRLVISDKNIPMSKLPFETYCSNKNLWEHVININKLKKGSFGEVSRLAIPRNFRHQNKHDTNNFFQKDERRFFPFIAVGLYLGVTKLVNECDLSYAFGLFETRLEARLRALGFRFHQCSEEITYSHGKRALFFIKNNDFSFSHNVQMRDLYQVIEERICLSRPQISLMAC